jgi:hypothetical protein
MNDGKLPPPFVIGEKYWDREGEYTVTNTDEGHITIERPDGRRTVADAALKARIHRNVVMERDADRRSVFGNEGDWAKATMTEERLHEVVGTTAHWQDGVRRECNVYRITPRGLDLLRKRG